MPQSGSVRLDDLKPQRIAAGMSVTELARRSNTSDQIVVMLEEGGNVSADVAQRVADALGLSMVALDEAIL